MMELIKKKTVKILNKLKDYKIWKKIFSLIISLIMPFLFSVFLIRLDIVTKEFVFRYLLKHNQITEPDIAREAIFSWLTFVNVHNTGLVWGVFQDLQYGHMIFILTGIILEISLFVIYLQSNLKMQKFSILLIFCGGFGNIYDRIKLGYVRDFIDIHFQNYHWPAFNFADILVSLGAIVLIILDILKKRSEIKIKNGK